MLSPPVLVRTISKQSLRSLKATPKSSTTQQQQQQRFLSSNVFGRDVKKSPRFSSMAEASFEEYYDDSYPQYQRIWKSGVAAEEDNTEVWDRSVYEDRENGGLRNDLKRIAEQEREGGRMRARQEGVLTEDPAEDVRLLMQNYTVPALASALRDREEVLQLCATLLAEDRISELRETLQPFERQYVKMRRMRKDVLDLTGGFDHHSLEMLRKGLMRMPRRVTQAYQKRAGVVLPLCNVDGVPCVLFEKRSKHLRAHPDEVCLPGGMVCNINDKSIVSTCLREMNEEIGGIEPQDVTVLGVLRCNWGEVAHIAGVAVTPVVGYLGEIGDLSLNPNEDEVAECFTVPLSSILDQNMWIHKENSAPIFTGGPHIIWGLTGYILERFVKDLMARYKIYDH